MFDYFYAEEADKFTFIRIPKELIINPLFSQLSSDAKILYGIMLDRMSLSRKNNWIDGQNRVYISYSIANIMEDLNVSKNTAIKTRKALDDETGIGLIHIEHQENGMPAIIYVKNFMSAAERAIAAQDKPENDKENTPDNNLSKKQTSSKNEQGVVQKMNGPTSSKNEQPPVQNLNPNNIYKNNNYDNKTYMNKSSLSPDEELERALEEREEIKSIIQTNIGYQFMDSWNTMLERKLDMGKIEIIEYDRDYIDIQTIDFLVDTMVTFICTKSEKWFVVGDERIPKSIVDEKLLTINRAEICEVAKTLILKRPRNKKNYAITCLFNI